MTHEEKVKLMLKANNVIDDLSVRSDNFMQIKDYENSHKENHKAQGAIHLLKELLNEMDNM